MSCLARAGWAHTSTPPTWAVPLVGTTRDVSMPAVVVLPAPFGPRRPKISPRRTDRSRPSTAVTPPGYTLVNATVWMTSSSGARGSDEAALEAEGAEVMVVRGGQVVTWTGGYGPPAVLGPHPTRHRRGDPLPAGSRRPGYGPESTESPGGIHMQMVTAFKLVVFERYAVFEGRAGRAEYWWFFLANFLIGLVIQVLAGVSDALVILSVIYSLALLIPGLAVAVRRLHDTNKSGWWILIALVPLVGIIVLIVFLATDGDSGANQYGNPDPGLPAAV